MMRNESLTEVSSFGGMETAIQKFTLSELVALYPGGIRIPMIQRDYAQGRASWEKSRKRFLNDIKGALHGGKPVHLDFIYGISQEEDETFAFCPLDGQQRLTTLFLLHWYLAARDGCFGVFQSVFLTDSSQSKFTYQVRPGGRSFFRALVHNKPSMEECRSNKPKDWICQQSWFRTNWERDPSVAGALTMLDAIHDVFHKEDDVTYQKLTHGDRITFQRLDLGAAGLHDDLYLRMNARGRPLTTFETFKARYEKYLKTSFPDATALERCTVKTAKHFSDRIDKEWLDFIWTYYGPEAVKSENQEKEDTSFVDKAFINLFRAVALASLEPTKANEEGKNTEKAITKKDAEKMDTAYVQSLSGGEPDYDDFENGGWLNTKFTTNLIHVLEACESLKNENPATDCDFILFQEPWFGEGRLLDLVVRHDGKKPDYADFLQFAACIRFLTVHGPVLNQKHRAEFDEWNRVVRNLVVNSTVGANTFLKILSGLDQLMKGSNDRGIMNFLADMEGELPGFNGNQIEEERLKAKLIRKDKNGWHKPIQDAEEHPYFRGQIDFLLDFSGAKGHIEDHANVQNDFRNYLQRAELMFSKVGVFEESESKQYLWQRALLAVGDYLLPDGALYGFGDPNFSSQASWKRLLEKDCDGKRRYLKELWDRMHDHDLQKIIATPTPDHWRNILCSRVDAWAYCWKRRIRYEERSKPTPRVFLLRGERRTTNNTYEELHSFCFRNNQGLSTDTPVDNGRFAPLKYTGSGFVTHSYHPHLKFELEYKGKNLVFQLYCHCHEDDGFSLRIPLKELGDDKDVISASLSTLGFESKLKSGDPVQNLNPWWLGEHLVLRQDPANPLDGASFLKNVADKLSQLP